MSEISRIYTSILAKNLSGYRQMALVSGPRQVGKTTVCTGLAQLSLNWDQPEDRKLILGPQQVLVEKLMAVPVVSGLPVLLLDEIHKWPKWKNWLKGLFDTYEKQIRVVVTGSSRLDVFRRGQDSMMGRYFLYRMHPLSVAELLDPTPSENLYRPAAKLDEASWKALQAHGGFPDPFLRREASYTLRWRTLRQRLMVGDDLRDLAGLKDVPMMEALITLLDIRSAQQLSFAALAAAAQVAPNTARRWIEILVQMHHGFLLRPWSRRVVRSLRKEPKWYLRDWSGVDDAGQRAETLVACHLLKAVELWNDLGLGRFELGYLRDLEKREVDFLVVRDGKPWFLAEVKKSDTSLHPALFHFQKALKAPLAFQVVLDLPYREMDCFAAEGPPQVVPARSFLSQLV